MFDSIRSPVEMILTRLQIGFFRITGNVPTKLIVLRSSGSCGVRDSGISDFGEIADWEAYGIFVSVHWITAGTLVLRRNSRTVVAIT